jgi:hypothetical protein
MRKTRVLAVMFMASFLSLAFFNSCSDKPGSKTAELKAPSFVSEQDSTLYGTCYAAAMHSFVLLTSNGDSIFFTRETVDEVGDLQGGLFEGDKLAVIAEKVGDEMFAKKVINLNSLLGKWTSLDRNFEIKDGGEVVSQGMAESRPYTEWKIINGQLLLSTDTFDIVTLGPDSLLLENSVGIFAYKRQ